MGLGGHSESGLRAGERMLRAAGSGHFWNWEEPQRTPRGQNQNQATIFASSAQGPSGHDPSLAFGSLVPAVHGTWKVKYLPHTHMKSFFMLRASRDGAGGESPSGGEREEAGMAATPQGHPEVTDPTLARQPWARTLRRQDAEGAGRAQI